MPGGAPLRGNGRRGTCESRLSPGSVPVPALLPPSCIQPQLSVSQGLVCSAPSQHSPGRDAVTQPQGAPLPLACLPLGSSGLRTQQELDKCTTEEGTVRPPRSDLPTLSQLICEPGP